MASLYLPHHEFARQQGGTNAFWEGFGRVLRFKKDHLILKDPIRLFVLFSFFLTNMLSCSKQSDIKTSDLEKQFSTIVPLADMDKSLEIAVARDVAINEQSFRLGSAITVEVFNKAPHFVSSNFNSQIKLLIYENSQWVEVKNDITYSDTMLISPQGTLLLDLQYTWVQPNLDRSSLGSSNTKIPVRIVVIGEIMEGNTRTGKNVGAYVDVFVKP